MKKTWFLRIAVVALVVLCLAVPAVSAATPEQIETSIASGLAWLASKQVQPGGYWEQQPGWGGDPGVTGLAVLKFEDRGKELMPDQNPLNPGYLYSSNVQNGLNYLFSQMQVDGSGNVFIPGFYSNYYTSIALLAVAASNNPNTLVNVPGSAVNGWTYLHVAQGMVNWLIATQESRDNPKIACEEGGWGYPNVGAWADQSNTGYSVLGLAQAQAPAPDGFGIIIPGGPGSVKVRLLDFTTNTQVTSGGALYNPCWVGNEWVNILKTGSLIQELGFAGVVKSDGHVQSAIGYIEDNWGATGRVLEGWNTALGWRDAYQPMFTMMKGFESYRIVYIYPGDVKTDWFDKVSDVIIANQNLPGDGSFNEISPAQGFEGENSANLRAAWALLTLERATPPLPEIRIKKSTNLDPDRMIHTGDPVTYSYLVKNYGNVKLNPVTVTDDQGISVSCPKTFLEAGEEMTCEATASPTATVTNTGTATGTDPYGTVVTGTSDPVTVTVINPAIAIVKTASPPVIMPGETVTYSYAVTNSGDVKLVSVTVTDDQGIAVSCPGTELEAGETMTCTATATPAKTVTNTGTAAGTDPLELVVSSTSEPVKVVVKIKVFVDIEPGFCPNVIGLNMWGKWSPPLPVAILGTKDFDVSKIDPASIALSRDGVAGSVKPKSTKITDVGAPYTGTKVCGCNPCAKRDRINDLVAYFDSGEVVNTLKLKEVAGKTVRLTITGTLKDDGNPIVGTDCIRVFSLCKEHIENIKLVTEDNRIEEV